MSVNILIIEHPMREQRRLEFGGPVRLRQGLNLYVTRPLGDVFPGVEFLKCGIYGAGMWFGEGNNVNDWFAHFLRSRIGEVIQHDEAITASELAIWVEQDAQARDTAFIASERGPDFTHEEMAAIERVAYSRQRGLVPAIGAAIEAVKAWCKANGYDIYKAGEPLEAVTEPDHQRSAIAHLPEPPPKPRKTLACDSGWDS